MTSERQFAANRRNALRSTGPRSAAGLKRASRNAYSHGLTAKQSSSAERSEYVEKLARKIAGNSRDQIVITHARTIAWAESELTQIRHLKVALLSYVHASGESGAPRSFQQLRAERYLNAYARCGLILPKLPNPDVMPTTEPERTAEAARRALPQLVKLDRYERRAAARRDRAVRAISEYRKKNSK